MASSYQIGANLSLGDFSQMGHCPVKWQLPLWLAEYAEMLQLDDGQKDAPSKVTLLYCSSIDLRHCTEFE